MWDIAADYLRDIRPVFPAMPKVQTRAPRNPALSVLSDIDQERFLDFGWGPEITPRFPTIISAINHHAAQQPDAIAAECQNQTLTYGELDAAANRLACVLVEYGVQRGDAVCLYLHRSIPMLVGIVASLRVGAAYVPQHVGVAPAKTLRHIASVTGAKVILTLSSLADQIPATEDQRLIAIDDVIADVTTGGKTPTGDRYQARPEDLCMILFTSGTTGVPNGVQVTHKNLCNILQTSPGDLGMRPGVRVGQILSIAFDMAAWETLGALSNGATLVIRGKSIQETAEQVDVLIATPSILNSLDQDRCRQIQTAAVAGEPCPRPLADTWGSFCRFYNSCGPTETTIINTAEPHFPGKEVLSIGRPTPNNTVYVLDENLRPVPIGKKGEMWAGGECVTAGYLANKGLTADRYRSDPFRPGHMVFRTKDLGRWTETGELEHFGRVDDLVKIRGFRVELDGVSNTLEATDECDQAVTLKFDNRNLVAFVSPATVCTKTAAQSVKDKLPYYCSPTLIVAMDELPRTPRGKLDKRVLLQLAQDHIDTQGVELN
ncbi:AMP-binding protein [Pseudovibrio sp. Tun.PSC04-5.I4]|uniref:AMP-binding protein n=1 Tax=Pseudovibrio sp. Tun.PSC04-5.I4 TaxID=1798213 RepID=UPI00088164CB|nr:AMP-binding protein [Pseudovibrio sp. Tun.PSC04-5.I4]SDQ24536.1 amino acid adenylation domain-containing protein [Pseudovibrio sp. Tun.PSC04-5.I4]